MADAPTQDTLPLAAPEVKAADVAPAPVEQVSREAKLPEATIAVPVAAAPVVEPAKPETPAAATPAAPETKSTNSPPPLLSDAGKPAPAAPQPSDVKPAKAEGEPAAPVATDAPAERPPAPTFQPFTLPEGISVEQERLGQFTQTLGQSLVDLDVARQSGTPEAISAASQQLGQQLVDLHLAEQKSLAERISQNQVDVWNRTREEWLDAVKSDPELGGNRIETVLNTAAVAIEQFAGPRDPKTGTVDPAQVAELREALRITGAEFHPAIVRAFYHMGKAQSEGRPVAPHNPVPPPQSRAERRYSGRNGAQPSA